MVIRGNMVRQNILGQFEFALKGHEFTHYYSLDEVLESCYSFLVMKLNINHSVTYLSSSRGLSPATDAIIAFSVQLPAFASVPGLADASLPCFSSEVY